MWQEAVKPYVATGQLVAIGVVQEQHPDRARLYRQWRQLDWPIFVDSMNLLNHVTVVPIPMALNEEGIVLHTNLRPPQLDAFIRTPHLPRQLPHDYNRIATPKLDQLRATAQQSQSPQAWHALGTAHFNNGKPNEINQAIEALQHALKLEPSDGASHFALGTALRRRYEGPLRHPTDAQDAVIHWGLALEANPNHYIWRRRLQQYGPRLDKPYNFYYWVEEARKDILARGQQPVALTAEPMGSEIAAPGDEETIASSKPDGNPDPDGRIFRDTKSLVSIETFATPARVQPGHRVRARINLRLDTATQPWWNNEADDLRIWLDLPDELTMIEQRLSIPNPELPETQELRQLEIEVAVSKKAPNETLNIPAYALYYVCENAGGVCYYLRQDFNIALQIDDNATALR